MVLSRRDTEYRMSVEKCIHCKIGLISGKERLRNEQQLCLEGKKRSMRIEPNDKMFPLLVGGLRDMKAIQHRLKNERIPSILTGDERCSSGCVPQLTLMIKERDKETAQAVIEKDFVESTGVSLDSLGGVESVFDIKAQEVMCPACNCRFAPTVEVCPDCGLEFYLK